MNTSARDECLFIEKKSTKVHIITCQAIFLVFLNVSLFLNNKDYLICTDS